MSKAGQKGNGSAAGEAKSLNPEHSDAFVIDDARGICVAVSLALQKFGLVVATFDNAAQALAALDRCQPQVIFLDVVLRQSDAVDVIKGLGERQYDGILQLMSANPRLLEAIQRVARRYHLTVRPPLPKPFGREVIAQVIAEAGLGGARAVAC